VNIERTEEANVFAISYEPLAEGQLDRILTLDEKKNRFTFADLEYFAAIDEALVPSQQRYGRLKNLKSLPTNERRKSDMILEHVFQAVGEQAGTRAEPAYQIDLDTLYVAYNVLRPASRSFLAALVAGHDTIEEDPTVPGIYTYRPEVDMSEDEEEDEEDWGAYDDE
jgi:hypothetical protein